MKNWFSNHEYAIIGDEQTFVDRAGDVVAFIDDDATFVRRALERLIPGITGEIFASKQHEADPKAATTRFFDNDALESFSSTVIVAFGLGLLFGPMWWLSLVDDGSSKLGIITGFVIFFSVVVHVGTKAQPSEVLGAAAAYVTSLQYMARRRSAYLPSLPTTSYAAVLVVFLQASSG